MGCTKFAPIQRRNFARSKNHPHATLSVEDWWWVASADIDIAAQCPLFAVRTGTWPARPLWCDVPFTLAGRTVGLHIQRGDMNPRRRIGTGHGVEAFDNHRFPGAVAFGKKVADHGRYLSGAWASG